VAGHAKVLFFKEKRRGKKNRLFGWHIASILLNLSACLKVSA
jgi:hypothetical protein